MDPLERFGVQGGYTPKPGTGWNSQELAWSIINPFCNDLESCSRLPGIPSIHIFDIPEPPGITQFRAVPGGSGGLKTLLLGILGSWKHNSKSFEKIFMMLMACSGLFLSVQGFLCTQLEIHIGPGGPKITREVQTHFLAGSHDHTNVSMLFQAILGCSSPVLGGFVDYRWSKIWLHCFRGSCKLNTNSFQTVFMMLQACSGLFWPVPGISVYPP